MSYIILRENILKRDNHTCQICNSSDKKLEVHHIIPKRMGGRDIENNLVSVCKSCHKKIEIKRPRKLLNRINKLFGFSGSINSKEYMSKLFLIEPFKTIQKDYNFDFSKNSNCIRFSIALTLLSNPTYIQIENAIKYSRNSDSFDLLLRDVIEKRSEK